MTRSEPSCVMVSSIASAISVFACSHEIRFHFPEPRGPTRFSGWRTRVGVVHALAEAAALLAAAGVEVGHVRVRLRVVGGLLLAPDDAVLHVDVPGAVGLVPAVHEVGAADDLVPRPAFAVDVAPVAVAGRGGRRSRNGGCGAQAPRSQTRAPAARHRRRRAGRSGDRPPSLGSCLLPLDGRRVAVEAAEHLLPLVGDEQVHQLGLLAPPAPSPSRP